jgi:hypothetical protein
MFSLFILLMFAFSIIPQVANLPVVIEASSFQNMSPNQGGFEEFVTLDTSPYDKDTVSLKMRAVDTSGNEGAWSPIMTIKLGGEVKLAPSLKHFERESSQSLQVNDAVKVKAAESTVYWEMFVFLAGWLICKGGFGLTHSSLNVFFLRKLQHLCLISLHY